MKKIVTVISVVVLLILGGLCCNKMSTSVWAMPFIHGCEIAVFKTTSRNDPIEKYYTIFENGSVVETEPRDLTSNILYYYFKDMVSLKDSAFTSVNIEHIIAVEHDEAGYPTKCIYVDAQGNEYSDFPEIVDDKLLAIQDDLLRQLDNERQGSRQFFLDGDNIFVVRLNDCGWTSNYQIYVYDINTRVLRSIAIISAAETVDWIYSE